MTQGAGRTTGSTRTLARGADGGIVRRTVLPGGLRVLTESMPGSRAASFGVWVGVGSMDETRGLAGASHYLEHLLFKGTPRRTALEISATLDGVGGDLNAFTTKEHTCYYAHVLAEDLPLALDVVCDVVTEALIAPADVEGERSVILEEIAMRDDDPADALYELFSDTLYGDTPLGRPVIGSVESIESMRRSQIAGYYRRRYQPRNMVIAAAGKLDHATVVRQVRKAFAGRLTGPAVAEPPRSGPAPTGRGPVHPVRVMHRPTEQAHLMLGMRGLARGDDRRFALSVLSTALGGGASSRLFQEVREKRGLVYSIYSFVSHHAATGMFGVYAGCQPGKADEVLTIISDQLAEIAAHGLPADEIARGKGQIRGGLVLGMEDAESRMSRLGKSELSYGDVLDIDDLLAKVEAVDVEAVRAVAADVLTRPSCLAVVGPFGEHDFDHVELNR
ncbi:MAG TPA: pitrilysin family protein [Mycobacteriales bacterium]|nr:pitrilysin family protein [Mycobacteriales bacterium]